MNPDEKPPAGQPGMETPPASLTAVRVGRRKAVAPSSGKAGDLTQKLGADAPDTRAAAAAAAVPPPTTAMPAPPTAEPPRGAAPLPLAAEPTPAPAPTPPTAEPRAEAPSPAEPRPSTRLLGEDEIRQLLDPPERRAAQSPTPGPAPEPPALAAREPEPAPLAPAPAPEPRLMVAPDERYGVPPAPASPELRLVTEAPAPTPKAEAPAEGPSSAAPPSSIDQIIDHWDGLRGDKPFPPLDKLDRNHVGRTWPNCMLVAYGANDTVMPRITRIGEENGDIEYLEMVIHWILSRGRIAARKGEPMEEEKRFPVTGGNARYQLLLLPLATSEGTSEHVLCHLSRVKETAKPKGGAFKRWLAG